MQPLWRANTPDQLPFLGRARNQRIEALPAGASCPTAPTDLEHSARRRMMSTPAYGVDRGVPRRSSRKLVSVTDK
jgi:hypothetical protein